MLERIHTRDGMIGGNIYYLNESATTNTVKIQRGLPPLPEIISPESYDKAKVDYITALQDIDKGDSQSTKAAWTDDLCALLVEYELMNGIDA